MKGFFCKAVMINVTDRTSTIRHLDEALLRASIGGKGLGAKLLLEDNQPGVDPLGPENHMIIASGPLAGSSLYGSSRYGVFAKSPLTHFYGESYSGGSFAIHLSQTGFDAVIIKGASASPVWLEITHEQVLFHDADRIWGKDTFEAEEYIRNRSNYKDCGVIVIGPAGENLIRFSVIKNDEHPFQINRTS